MIRRNFFNDPIIAGQYNECQRFLLIGLACASNDWGKFWWNSKNLKSIIYPLDSKQVKWIEKNLEIFYKDGILCKYDVKNLTYGHFPLWFDKKFCLKQQLNHPKDDEFPVCEHHPNYEKSTENKRETSHTIETKLNQINKKEYKSPIPLVEPLGNAPQDEIDEEGFAKHMKEIADNFKTNTRH